MSDKNKMKEDELDRLYYESLSDEVPMKKDSILPNIVEKYVNSAAEVSMYNEIPAALTFFVLLGQLSKDMVAIPFGRRVDDTRIQLIWMQTSGTGKSEMYNFFGPISNYVFNTLNEKYGCNFDVFNVKDITDAALIGSFEKNKEPVEDENGQVRMIEVMEAIPGALEGDGLCCYDEFEYSGVFKPSMHKENVIMYMNTFMNTIHGQNWVITVKRKGSEELECRCQRSIFATTYIPKTMTSVIAETGIMQRSILYIREVPIEIQNELRERLAQTYGKVVDRKAPIEQFGKAFVKIYETLMERYEEVDGDSLSTIKFHESFSDAVVNETKKFEQFVQSSRPAVLDLANNFITRMQGNMGKMAVLCCIAEAPTIKDKDKRFVATSKHVVQAAHLIKQCYKSLVSWLDMSLKQEYNALLDASNIKEFKKQYDKMIASGLGDTQGYVHKTMLLENVRKHLKKGQATVYRHYKQLLGEQRFDETKKGQAVYTKIKEEMQ